MSLSIINKDCTLMNDACNVQCLNQTSIALSIIAIFRVSYASHSDKIGIKVESHFRDIQSKLVKPHQLELSLTMDIELQDQNGKSDRNAGQGNDENTNNSGWTAIRSKILQFITDITGMEKDCLFATVSYYSRLLIWTAFLYFYVGGIGAVGALFTLRAILGYILLLAFLIFMKLYYLDYYEILKWFATPSLIFLKSWTSLFFFAYLVQLPFDLQSVRFAQIISWLFQVGFGKILHHLSIYCLIICVGNILSLALTVMIINIVLWFFSLWITKEEPEPPIESKKDKVTEETISEPPKKDSEEVAKDFQPTLSPSKPPTSAEEVTSVQRRESTMSTLSVGLRTSFAVDAALGRMSLQAYSEAKYLQYALSKGSKHSVDEVGATVHEDEFDKKLARLSMKQAIYGTYNLAEMTRPVAMMRGNSSGNLAAMQGNTSGNNISGLADVNRESIVVQKNNARLVMIHSLDYDGAMRGSVSRMSIDRASLAGVRVRPVTGRFKPAVTGIAPRGGGGGDNAPLSPIAGPHSLHNTLHTDVRPKSSPRSPSSSPSSENSRKHSSRPLPSLPGEVSQSDVTTNPLNSSTLADSNRPFAGSSAVPMLRGVSKLSSVSSLEIIEEGEDEDRATEVSRSSQSMDFTKSSVTEDVFKASITSNAVSGVVASKEPTIDPVMDDYEMEYPEEALADTDVPQEEEISIALPFIPTMQQLFVFWKYVAVATAIITYLMPNKTHGSVVAFQLACSILAFILSTTYRTKLLGSMPMWIHMPLQSFVIFTPIVIILVILSSTEGAHNWQGCLQQYIVVPNGIVKDIQGYGAGNFLVMFLNPAIVSLAFSTVDPLLEYYQLLPLMIPAIVVSCVVITIQNASISRILASPSVIASPLLIRTVTIPIAIEITNAINASTGITVATVLVNAVLALRLFPTYLTYMKVNSPVTRGVSCGVCGTLLGVVALDDRGENVAAGIGMAGFGIATISFGLIMTIAVFRDFVSQLS